MPDLLVLGTLSYPSYRRPTERNTPTPVTPEQVDLLDAFLSHDFPGVEALRAQTPGLLAKRGCLCGCGTIDLIPQRDGLEPSDARSPVEVSGHVVDADGNPVGGVMLWLEDGFLTSLEVYSYDEPLPLPAVSRLEWQLTPRG
jgi:hypothetical protein